MIRIFYFFFIYIIKFQKKKIYIFNPNLPWIIQMDDVKPNNSPIHNIKFINVYNNYKFKGFIHINEILKD